LKEKGLFIVLEGSDGSGKTTQFNLLKERLKAVGYDVAVFDFPRYDRQSSYFVKKYLNGQYGDAAKVSPYTASLFYALDRYEAAKDIKQALKDGKIVISNRYAGSNMAHQGSKFDDPVEQRSFFVWADNLEFELLKIPRPDLNLFLRVPAETAYELIAKKSQRNYTKDVRDEHERDRQHLKKSVQTYDLLCQLFPKDFRAIECTSNDKLMSVAKINDLIWSQVKPLLPAKKAHASHSVVVTLGGGEEDNKDFPATSDQLNHSFKDASMMLRLVLERQANQVTRPSFTDWAQSGYRFYTPAGLPKEIAAKYRSFNEQLSGYHQQLLQRLARYLDENKDQIGKISLAELILPVTPLSAIDSFAVQLKKDDVKNVASGMLAEDSDELQWAAKQLYLAARHNWPQEFAEPLESSDGPVALNQIIAKLAEDHLPQVFSADDAIKLLEARPRLEFDLLAESIYPFSSLSLDEIVDEVSSWPYMQKYDNLKEAAGQAETLQKVSYKLDIISDHLTMNKLINIGRLQDFQVQAFTPRYGYDVPEIIENAKADDLYDACFDESLKIYSLLQGADKEDSAPYVTLLGHKVRWQMNIDARQLKRLVGSPELKGDKTMAAITEKISESHPLLWEIISGQTPKPVSPNGKSRVKPVSQRRRSKPKKS
jgi:dTMP kinase